MIRLNVQGRNRFVLLTRCHAIKIPSLRCWRDFLFGLLNNLNEAAESATHEAHCPVRWAAPLGLAIVMPRVEILDDAAFALVQDRLPAGTQAEAKASSWGHLQDRLVAVDYGWPA